MPIGDSVGCFDGSSVGFLDGGLEGLGVGLWLGLEVTGDSVGF